MEAARPGARTAAIFVTAVLAAASLLALQRCFDESDRRKAVRLVLEQPSADASVASALERAADGGSVTCEASLTSSWAGRVSVTCAPSTGPSYRWDVDLVRRTATPQDPSTRSLTSAP